MNIETKTQTLEWANKLARLQEQLTQIDKEVKLITDCNGTVHIGIGLGGAHVAFGQLWERYEQTLREPLITLIMHKRKIVQDEIDLALGVLQDLFTSVEAPVEDLWYPDLPGWTWHEHTTGKQPVGNTELVYGMLEECRNNQKLHYSDPDEALHWDWSNDLTGGWKIVAYATKNV